MSLFTKLYALGGFRAALWRFWYPYVTRRLQGQDVLFLNYGFETDPPLGLALAPEDEPHRACIQLYHHVATQVELGGKHLLEVSCGHGGGASYLARTLRPATYTAVDLNPAGIRFCEGKYAAVEGLTFFAGDAENLPFAAETVDAVINIEASHCYPSFPRFLAEVTRVLRPGGFFLYADFRFNDDLPAWLDALGSTTLELVHARDISSEVVRGLEMNAPRSSELIALCLPKWLHSLGRDFAGLPGSYVYNALQGGQAVYHSYCFMKPAGEAAPDLGGPSTAVT
jgi:ubiquinone/menaquinone biosynthesis C-methylase UbiE